MNVQGPGSGGALPPGLIQGTKGREVSSETNAHQPRETPPSRGKGVLRLLQQGHFKGVADARLRINFADEIETLAQNQAAEARPDALADLLAAVESLVTEFVDSDAASEEIRSQVRELYAQFQATLSEIIQPTDSDANGNLDRLVADIETAFGDFTTQLTALLADPVSTPDPPVSADEAETATLSEEFQAFLDALQAAFAGALGEFRSVLESAAAVLPELSEPNGNGVAFAKFVEALAAIQGGGDPPDSPSDDSTNLTA